ncbi:CehA/McbA family metallohydrolase [Myxococcota bacterium]|nr:CehA/McbA family metallohydrolase [Myxococcota bacterium]
MAQARLLAPLVFVLGLGCGRAAEPPVTPAVARESTSARDLLWGPCAGGAIGDVILENGELVAVISKTERANGFAMSPGNLVDLAWLPDGEDHLNEVFLYLNDEFPRQAHYTKVAVVSAGGGSKAAVVRATGVDSKDPGITIETEYRLEPGASWITLSSKFTSRSEVRAYRIGDVIQWGRTRHMAPGHGYDLPGQRVQIDWVAGIGDGISYALVPNGQHRLDTPNGSVWSDPIGEVVDLAPGAPVTYVRHIAVGRGDTASLAPSIAHLRGDRTGRLTGSVIHAGEPVRDAVVRIFDEGGKLAGLAAVDRTGWYRIDLAPGRYRATATAPGRTPVDGARPDAPIEIREGTTAALGFEMGARATLAWRIEGDDGRAPSVKVTIVGVDGTPSPELGPSFDGRGADNFVVSARGLGETAVGPGRYRVLVSRGPEFELIERTVTATAGARAEVTGRFVRAFETPGFIAADLHQHSSPSFDSGVSLEDRAISNAAEGVEVLTSTEHNILVDYRPVIAELGLGRVLNTMLGVEATTHSVGHFNAFPVRLQPEKLRGGMVDPEGMTPRQIFDLLRSLRTPDVEPFVQVNHPRSGKVTGYFDIMGLDPRTGRATDPRYVEDFDGVEVITFGSAEETRKAVADWHGLLARGHRVTATGSSDSHTISVREVGWPRTYVCVGDDAPPNLDTVELTTALREGCATISAGPFVVIRSGEVRMGGLAMARGGKVTVEVEVEAASWIPTDALTLLVDGRAARTVPLGSDDVARHRGAHVVDCRADCAIVAMVTSETPIGPVLARDRGRKTLPVGLTNPIYVDADGDGRWSPPRAVAR